MLVYGRKIAVSRHILPSVRTEDNTERSDRRSEAMFLVRTSNEL